MSTEIDDALHTLHYSRPARLWTDALPVGNGVRAAMCEGTAGGERLHLNDATAWSGLPDGDPLRGTQDRGPEALAAVRDAIARGEFAEAERLLHRQQTHWSQTYLPLATLDIELIGVDASQASVPRRSVDFRTAVASHTYDVVAADGRASVTHDTWADAVSGSIVHRVRADRPIAVRLRATSPLEDRAAAALHDGVLVQQWHLPIDAAPTHARVPEPVRYDFAVGRSGAIAVRSSSPAVLVDGWLVTDEAVEHTITIGTGTDAVNAVPAALATASDPLDVDIEAHVAAHQQPYLRCVLDLPSPDDVDRIDSDVRVERSQTREDQGLAALLFHYGRYLLISSAVPGGLPPNLQGIWNAELLPPWSSGYTTNINLQMAHWAVESTSLPECHRPLLDFIRRSSETTGAVVARELYGTRGWVMHHNSDRWGHAAPVGNGSGDVSWATWPLGGVWLATHFWDHYTFSGDVDVLVEAWPVFESTALFALDWIQQDGERAWTSPSTSPENTWLDDGAARGVSTSTTMDVTLLRELAAICRQSAAVLGPSDDWIDELTAVTDRLPAIRVNADGRIAEWDTDLVDAEPLHRHLSHLVGLFPFAQISPARTPELATAAGASIIGRGAESTGWALSWRAAMWARLRDGERVHEHVLLAQRPATGGVAHRAGLYRNLFSAHPPFQIDGNLGLTAAIAEALVQSHEDGIDLLPALPAAWPDGAVRGLRARGGITVDVAWSAGTVRHVRLLSAHGGRVRIAGPGLPARTVDLDPGVATDIHQKER